MTAYRRSRTAGATYFFTVNLADCRLSLLTGHIDLLRAAFRYRRLRRPFTIDAVVQRLRATADGFRSAQPILRLLIPRRPAAITPNRAGG